MHRATTLAKSAFQRITPLAPTQLTHCILTVHLVHHHGFISFATALLLLKFVCIMATAKASISDKQYLAKILYTRENLEQKIIAKKVGVSEKTISKWVNEFNWKSLRNRLVIGKEEILSGLYDELAELQLSLQKKAPGEKYSDSKQADIKIKLTASIRNLETELAIADLVESGIRFIKHLQKVGTIDQVVEISDLWNSFIQASIKR